MGVMARMTLIILLLASSLLSQDFAAEKERALAVGMLAELRRLSAPYDNPAAAEYTRRIAAKLAEPGTHYTFEIVRTAAFEDPASLPNGHIFVPAQTFVKAEDETEFAAALAHSIAHVTVRPVISRKPGTIVYLPLLFHTSLIPLGLRGEHAALEAQVDEHAARLLTGAGFDPSALRRYSSRTAPYTAPPDTPLQSSEEFQSIRESVREILPLSRARRPPTLRRAGEVTP